jgi:GT2 family glycosyltransferase
MISLIIPFHNDFERIEETINHLILGLKKYPILEVIFSYNGINPLDKKIISSIEKSNSKFKVCETSCVGIGAGYKKGILEAKGEWILLSASDLPFRFTDLENFLRRINSNEEAIYLGSKLHSDSKIERNSFLRTILTYGFFIFRRLLFGAQTPKDCQGTIFLKSTLAKEIITKIPDDDFVFSFKLSQIGLLKKYKVIEVPVELIKSKDISSVNPIKTSMVFFLKIIRFRILTWFDKDNFDK